jgi:malonate transporter
MSPLAALTRLAWPFVVGYAFGALGVFPRPGDAIEALNRYALYLAFPALLFATLLRSGERLPTEPGFWVLVPAAALLTTAALRVIAPRRWRPHFGTLVLTGVFGNVAYLGLPVVEAVFGSGALGEASLLASAHVLTALLLAPWALTAAGRGSRASALLGALQQPIVWAPLLGLGARQLDRSHQTLCLLAAEPFASSASTVVLFLLGLYMHTHGGLLRSADRVVAAHVFAKLLLLPALTALLGVGLHHQGWLRRDQLELALLLAVMPTAATTYPLAVGLGADGARVAQAIVASTAVAGLMLAGLTWWTQ